MCGIAGYVDFSSASTSPDVLERMVVALTHRGPDGHGVIREGPCGLAHTRLSIIDLEGSPQPMRVAGSKMIVTYNGEIYNYQKLRASLKAQGVSFETQGDTEALLHIVDRSWDKGLPELDGMFAFAVWDSSRQRLLMARDPIGIKPLFYATPAPGILVFASEIKAVLQHPAVQNTLNHDALRQVLRFRAVYGRQSLYANVQQLEPGAVVEFSENGLTHKQHFKLEEHVDAAADIIRGKTERQLVDMGHDLLLAAVQKRMVADVDVGAFLSGGLDSSLIVALMRKCRGPDEDVHTFSVGFRNDANSETPYAQVVADAIKTKHTEILVSESDYIDQLIGLTAYRDSPLSEPADVAIAQMSQIARQQVKVVLSGEGSDEAFCGYPKYRYANAGSLLRLGLRWLNPDRTATLAKLIGMDHRRARVAARAMSHRNELDRLVQWFSYFDMYTLQNLLPGLSWNLDSWGHTTISQQEAIDRANGHDAYARMQYVDCLTWLPGNLLERADRMTMACGLEARVPFLDKQVVPFGLALSAKYKVRGKSLKWIVRQWANNYIPRDIIDRPKWGFRVPLSDWFRTLLRNILFDYLTSKKGLCSTFGDSKEVMDLLTAHDTGKIDAHMELWTLLTAEIWYQDVYLRQNRPGHSAAASSEIGSSA